MEIKTIQKDRLQNMEHFQFAGHVIAMCEESAIEKIKAVLEPLKTAVAEEDKALNLPRKQEGTADLEELDRVRDQAYRALQLLIEMHSCSDDMTKRKSAQQMSDVLGRYPKLAVANYDKETGMIKNLVTDLNAAELSVAVAQLGASGSITRLSAANSDFELRYRSLLKSAQQMSDVLGRYPKLAVANYDKETGMIKNLVTDLNAAEMSVAVAQLGASGSITRLSAANSDFELRYRSLLKSAQPSGVFDVKVLRAATDKALNAVIRRMDALDELEPETPKLPELIQQYNALVDKYRLTLAHRAGTSQTARNKRTAEYEARLKPGFAALEQLLKLEKGSLSFTGKTEGTGAKRHYELAVKGQTAPDGKPKTIWVGVNKDGSLFLYEKKSAKPGAAGTTEKPEYEIKPKAQTEE